LEWRRLWLWTKLQKVGFFAVTLNGITILWNQDGTRALIVPQGTARGAYALSMQFQGDIGAEAPCVTLNGVAVSEPIALAPIEFAPIFRRLDGQPKTSVN
jgi:hypothetical protein